MKLDKEQQAPLARGVLTACGIPRGADYHTLSNSTVESLLMWADHYGYRKPKNANGSRARYFHDLMQRRAKAS
jgi:hypothetical protein